MREVTLCRRLTNNLPPITAKLSIASSPAGTTVRHLSCPGSRRSIFKMRDLGAFQLVWTSRKAPANWGSNLASIPVIKGPRHRQRSPSRQTGTLAQLPQPRRDPDRLGGLVPREGNRRCLVRSRRSAEKSVSIKDGLQAIFCRAMFEEFLPDSFRHQHD